MEMDYLDFLVDSTTERLTGYFYKRRPKTKEDGRLPFQYEQLDPNSKVFDKVLGNVRADRATYAIKTNDYSDFNVGGYIITQNGKIWEITEVITNEQVKGNNDALWWFKTAKNVECSVRMIEIDELFNQEESYVDECKITITVESSKTAVTSAQINIVKGQQGIDYTIDGIDVICYVPKGSAVSGKIFCRYELGSLDLGVREFKISGYQTQNNEYKMKV